MRCPRCAEARDRVVDSREVEDGSAVRRRRECLACGYRYTTLERSTGPALFVLKRQGLREPFQRDKVVAGIRAACKNRPVDPGVIESVVNDLEASLVTEGPTVTSARVGVEVLERLRALDEVAYVRFASVYKGFGEATDFVREADLLQKSPDAESRTRQGAGP